MDYAKFPEARRATFFEIFLEPGDMLYLPAGWWHATENVSAGLSLSVNFFMRGTVSALGMARPPSSANPSDIWRRKQMSSTASLSAQAGAAREAKPPNLTLARDRGDVASFRLGKFEGEDGAGVLEAFDASGVGPGGEAVKVGLHLDTASSYSIVSFAVGAAGTYVITLRCDGSELPQSPFRILIKHAVVAAAAVVAGPGPGPGAAGEPSKEKAGKRKGKKKGKGGR